MAVRRDAETDVAVIGAGPAGAAAALTLGHYTKRSCWVLEASDQQGARAGESVSGGVRPLLDYLGVDPAVVLAATPSFETQSTWGGGALIQRASLFSGYGEGWNLDRRRFDRALADSAADVGAQLAREVTLRSVERADDGRWRLTYLQSGEPQVLQAREIVDASGRRGWFGRRAGGRRVAADRLVGVAALVEPRDGGYPPPGLLIEPVADGWWYAAALPEARAIAAYMTDSDLLRARGGSVRDAFLDHFRGTERVSKVFREPAADASLRVSPAGGQRMEPCIGPGWIAAGDAAASFDPLSSLGVGHALSSGIQAARIVHDRLDGHGELAHAYPADVDRLVAAYGQARMAAYAAERRWSRNPFWARRQARG